jgi:ribosome biogenesis GTPase
VTALAFPERLGFPEAVAEAAPGCRPPGEVELARVVEDHGVGYVVATDPQHADPEPLAECGADVLRAFRKGKGPRPVVGDWVWIRRASTCVIEAVIPRSSQFSRRRSRRDEEQIIAANVDIAFVVTSFGSDLNPRRTERFLTTALDAGARPVVVVNKLDLALDPQAELEALAPVIGDAPIICVANPSGDGVEAVRSRIPAGATVVFLGSSGVGKSTLVNNLLGREAVRVGDTRADGKGRHTTTSRQLLALPGGGVVIDTPGIRELALWEAEAGLEEAFDDVVALASRCRFGDCKHEHEPGCAVQAAVGTGSLDASRAAGFRKLRAELDESARRQSARKRAASHVRGPAPARKSDDRSEDDREAREALGRAKRKKRRRR